MLEVGKTGLNRLNRPEATVDRFHDKIKHDVTKTSFSEQGETSGELAETKRTAKESTVDKIISSL